MHFGYNGPPHGNSWYQQMARNFGQAIREDRKRSEDPYLHLMDDGTFDALPRSSTPPVHIEKGTKKGRFSEQEIEAIARDLHTRMWKNRHKLLPGRNVVKPIDILDPLLALDYIGYQCSLDESLGQTSWEGEMIDVAGIIDSPEKTVRISRRFPPPIRKFTAAHELGHAILHGGKGLHRDRACDGTKIGIRRNRMEFEADIFAKYFLMPERLVQPAFEHIFKTQKFVLNEETAFALNVGSMNTPRSTFNTLRDLSRLLARTTRYDGIMHYSLAEQFGVSDGAMAIRLEELGLVRL